MAGKTKKRKKKVVIKKRFYVFCLIFLLLMGTGVYFGAKAIINVFSDEPASEQASDPSGEGETEGSEADGDVKDKNNAMDDGVQPAVMFNSTEEGETEGSEPADNEEAALTVEEQIRDAILTSWYVSPLGQRRTTIEDTFGKLTRYENWNGGIYYHTKFAETMYITYDGKNGEDGMPAEDSVCTSVSLALKKIIEVEEFKPSTVWGDFHKDKSGFGWTDNFYSVLIQNNIKMIIYCDEEGNIDKETHIVVELV